MKEEILQRLFDWVKQLSLEYYYVDAEIVGLDEDDVGVSFTVRLKKKPIIARQDDKRT